MVTAGVTPTGLGTPLVRYGLVLAWVAHVVNGMLSGFVGHAAPWSFVAYVAALVSILFLTTQNTRPLSPPRAGATVVATLMATGLALLLDTVEPRAALAGLTAFILALLAIRGNLAAAAIGAAGMLAEIVAWGMYTQTAAAEVGVHLVVNASVAGVGFLCRLLLVRIVNRERAHRRAEARSTLAAQVAQESARLAAAELALVRHEVLPLLTALRDGVPLDRAALDELAVTEAAIRDRIRVPRLQAAGLPRAIRSARERGVGVHLMGHPDDERPLISDALADAVARLLAAQSAGDVTIRTPPPRYDEALTVLISTPESTTRMAFNADGVVIGLR